MKMRLTSFVLVLALFFSLSFPAFAVDDNKYYSLPSVASGEPSLAIDWPVMPAAEYSQQLTTIIDNLGNISKQITVIQSNQSVLGRMISNLTTIVTNIHTALTDIHSSMGAYQALLTAISNKVATENTLSSLSTFLNQTFSTFYTWGSPSADGRLTYSILNSTGNREDGYYMSWTLMLSNLFNSLTFDGDAGVSRKSEGFVRPRTIYSLIHQLQEVLASDEDKALSQSQKENRGQIEQDFVSGSSGKTSLGKGDFSNASQVGGALNDTFNMGGAAKVSDFLSGFGSAGTESQAWFSQTTSNNLNAVEAGDGTSGVSTFSDDGQTMVDVDPDPFNMGNIFERYDWLEGVNMDD